jgi:hypothetical protein
MAVKARRVLLAGALVLLGAPVAVFLVAVVIGSDTLAFLAGLSLMIVLSLVPLIALCVLLWWLVWGRRRGEPVTGSTSPPPAASATTASAAAAVPVTPSPGSAGSDDALQWLNRRRGVLLMAAGILAGFWVMLAVGFWLDDRYEAPAPVTVLFPVALVVLIVALAAAARYVWTHRGEFVPRFSSIGSVSLWPSKDMARRRKWIASMAADPRRRRYAEMIEAGDWFWTPERVEYDLDPGATATCAHLAPVESAMRGAGVEVRMSGVNSVYAKCLVDGEALAKQFALPEGTGYQELQTFDRGGEELSALVTCDSCRSYIWLLHPKVAAADTPVFP